MKLKFVVLGGSHAGKTSVLRRYFHGTFDESRMPTVGADFYSGRIEYPSTRKAGSGSSSSCDEKKDGSPRRSNVHSLSSSSSSCSQTKAISIQIWDTPGRERYSNLDSKKKRYIASFSDSFLRDVDAAVLMYDASSSTSFTHVLKWHSELTERLRRMEASGERLRSLPILIVGNKIDIFEERHTQKQLRKKEVVHQRDVLGLNSNFRGNDYRYEYTVSRPSTIASSTLLSQSPSSADKNADNTKKDGKGPNNSHRNRFELSTYMGTKTNYVESVLNHEMYRGFYLDSLLSSEDKSFPDKDMVLLWCMRNGLRHMDVSAKSGTGIDDLVQELIRITLEQQLVDNELRGSNSNICVMERNDELDLQKRYAPKSKSCFPLPFQLCCKP
mmetsp:Transcript_19191/g.30922  ORF Transcript_19191/g.30922 Transcript_19191/m.30922 type:complete len:385 (+) Transcript_19191:195-1349(+)